MEKLAFCNDKNIVTQCFDEEFTCEAGITTFIGSNWRVDEEVSLTLLVSIITPTYIGSEAQKVTIGLHLRGEPDFKYYDLLPGNTIAIGAHQFHDIYVETFGTGNPAVIRFEGKIAFEFCDDFVVKGIKCTETETIESIAISENIVNYYEVVPSEDFALWQCDNCKNSCCFFVTETNNNTLLKDDGEGGTVNAVVYLEVIYNNGQGALVRFVEHPAVNISSKLLVICYNPIAITGGTDGESGSADVKISMTVSYWD